MTESRFRQNRKAVFLSMSFVVASVLLITTRLIGCVELSCEAYGPNAHLYSAGELCYWYVWGTFTQPDAEESCNQTGGRLAALSDRNSNLFVLNTIFNGTCRIGWFGIKRNQYDIWVTWNGTSVTWTKWARNYPTTDGDCVKYGRFCYWRNTGCGISRQDWGAICEAVAHQNNSRAESTPSIQTATTKQTSATNSPNELRTHDSTGNSDILETRTRVVLTGLPPGSHAVDVTSQRGSSDGITATITVIDVSPPTETTQKDVSVSYSTINAISTSPVSDANASLTTRHTSAFVGATTTGEFVWHTEEPESTLKTDGDHVSESKTYIYDSNTNLTTHSSHLTSSQLDLFSGIFPTRSSTCISAAPAVPSSQPSVTTEAVSGKGRLMTIGGGRNMLPLVCKRNKIRCGNQFSTSKEFQNVDLKIKRENTKKFLRRFVSVTDERISSRVMGQIGVAVIVAIWLFVFFLDIVDVFVVTERKGRRNVHFRNRWSCLKKGTTK